MDPTSIDANGKEYRSLDHRGKKAHTKPRVLRRLARTVMSVDMDTSVGSDDKDPAASLAAVFGPGGETKKEDPAKRHKGSGHNNSFASSDEGGMAIKKHGTCPHLLVVSTDIEGNAKTSCLGYTSKELSVTETKGTLQRRTTTRMVGTPGSSVTTVVVGPGRHLTVTILLLGSGEKMFAGASSEESTKKETVAKIANKENPWDTHSVGGRPRGSEEHPLCADGAADAALGHVNGKMDKMDHEYTG